MKHRALLVMLLLCLAAACTPHVPERRVDVATGVALNVDNGPSAVLSPDGTRVVLVGDQLYVRRLDGAAASATGAATTGSAASQTSAAAQPLAGTTGARDPFFSPDGASIAFFNDGKLMKVPASGGAAIVLCDVESPRGGAWTADGAILVATMRGGILRVPATGGKPEPLTKPRVDDREVTHRWPQSLSHGRLLLYTANSDLNNFEQANAVLQDLRTGRRKIIHRGGYHYRYLASGHLLYISQARLFTVPFDIDKFEVAGTASPAIENIAARGYHGGAQISVSDNGTLAYVTETFNGAQTINWLSADGTSTPLRATEDHYYGIAFSPDGSRLAFGLSDGYKQSIAIYDWTHNSTTPLTATTAASAPLWTPDGKRVTYVNSRNIFWQSADGTGVAQRLTSSQNIQVPEAWDASGKFLAFGEIAPGHASDIKILKMNGKEPGEIYPLAASEADEFGAAFSPDGQWFCFVSNGGGTYNVWVAKLNRPKEPWQASPHGGTLPVWSKDGKRIFFRGLDGRIMVTSYTNAYDNFSSTTPVPWSDTVTIDAGQVRSFDIAPNGRIAALMAPGDVKPSSVTLIYNFLNR